MPRSGGHVPALGLRLDVSWCARGYAGRLSSEKIRRRDERRIVGMTIETMMSGYTQHERTHAWLRERTFTDAQQLPRDLATKSPQLPFVHQTRRKEKKKEREIRRSIEGARAETRRRDDAGRSSHLAGTHLLSESLAALRSEIFPFAARMRRNIRCRRYAHFAMHLVILSRRNRSEVCRAHVRRHNALRRLSFSFSVHRFTRVPIQRTGRDARVYHDDITCAGRKASLYLFHSRTA